MTPGYHGDQWPYRSPNHSGQWTRYDKGPFRKYQIVQMADQSFLHFQILNSVDTCTSNIYCVELPPSDVPEAYDRCDPLRTDDLSFFLFLCI